LIGFKNLLIRIDKLEKSKCYSSRKMKILFKTAIIHLVLKTRDLALYIFIIALLLKITAMHIFLILLECHTILTINTNWVIWVLKNQFQFFQLNTII